MIALERYLDDKYGVIEVMSFGVSLFITCEGEVSPFRQCPFTIVGCIGVRLGENDATLLDIFAPTRAQGEELKIAKHLIAQYLHNLTNFLQSLLWLSYGTSISWKP